MDEHDVIPRREAALGLGLLAMLSVALVGTIVFRIVQAAPRQAPSEAATTWAAAAQALPLEQPSAAAQQVATDPLPSALLIPTIDDGAGSVPAASTESYAAPTPIVEPSPAPVVDERPVFIAPRAR